MTKGNELRNRLMSLPGREIGSDHVLSAPVTISITFLRKQEPVTETRNVVAFCYNSMWFDTIEHHSLPFWAVMEYTGV